MIATPLFRDVDPLDGHRDATQSWRRLPDAPLTPRDHAVVVGVGDRVLVAGGWEFLCPPMADCATPEGPPARRRRRLRPGHRLLEHDRPRAVRTASAGVRHRSARRVGVPALRVRRRPDVRRPDAAAVLRPGRRPLDRPRPGGRPEAPSSGHRTRTDPGGLLGQRRGGEVADLVFDPQRSTWTKLPDDPLPRTFDRFVAPVGDLLVLAGSSSAAGESGEGSPRLAGLDLATREWSALPDAPGQGYQLLPTDRGPLLNGHFVDSPGWLLDPDTWAWSPLRGPTGEDHDPSGVLDRHHATYDIPNSVGQMASTMRLSVYDSVTQGFVTIPAPPGGDDVYDDSSTALGGDLFVFGGQRWGGDGLAGSGELVGDGWLWTAPVD